MSEQPEKKYAVQLQWGVKIPMRDGVRLNATLYLPKDRPEPRPAIFCLTPYTATREHPEAVYLAERGYAYLAIDVRGRGNSEGEFEPFFNDPADGHDVVEWIASQPYCNGQVASRGISYVGFTQWAAVRGGARRLATIVPSAPCWVGLDYPFRFNVFFSPFLAQWLLATSGKVLQAEMLDDQDFWRKRYLEFLESGLPFRECDKFFGFHSKPFREWLEHPHQEDYWDRANPTPEQLANLKMPVLSLTGVYDGDQPGTIEFYRQHLKNAGASAEHYLVIGPWDHARVRNPAAEFMTFKCGPDSVVDMKKLHGDWYAWTMENGEKPAFLKQKVAYYVMDAEKWRYADTLDEITAQVRMLHLDSITNPADDYQAGTLSPQPAARTEPDHYIYDPRDLSVARLEASQARTGALDEGVDLAALSGKLTYHSAPFEVDTEVSGFFGLTAWLSIDQPDTDISAYLFDVGLDGRAVYLASQILRARYREGLRVEKLINSTEPLPYEFNRFFFVSRRIRKGHRLRLVIGPSVSMGWQRNYNSGKPVADESVEDARTVTVRLHHDAAHPSVLTVPIGRPES